MILLLDNYDSFVFNLARYFRRLGQETVVVRNDAIDAAGIETLRPEAIVISPGPCAPQQAGRSLEIVRRFHDKLPILGVCLGHQAIGEALGGRIVRAAEPVHGRTSLVYHDGRGVFAGLDNPMTACRYHSLVVEESSLAAELEVTARTGDGVVMALTHRAYPVVGVQFHPESILTPQGTTLLCNFLRQSGIAVGRLPDFETELVEPPSPERAVPREPVTF